MNLHSTQTVYFGLSTPCYYIFFCYCKTSDKKGQQTLNTQPIIFRSDSDLIFSCLILGWAIAPVGVANLILVLEEDKVIVLNLRLTVDRPNHTTA